MMDYKGIFVQSTILANKMIRHAPGVHVWGFLKFCAIYTQLDTFFCSQNTFFSLLFDSSCNEMVLLVLFWSAQLPVWKAKCVLVCGRSKKIANFPSKKQFINGLTEDSKTNALALQNSIHVFFSTVFFSFSIVNPKRICSTAIIYRFCRCKHVKRLKNNYAVQIAYKLN